MSHQDPDGPGAFWHRFKGGDVDRGAPVREAAEDLHGLLVSADRIRTERSKFADPSSLVPVGTNREVAYASDEVRLRMLKADMARQAGKATKSNLKKAESGFGSGFNSASGGTVVGAAHGIDEMLAMAKREKKKYSDEPAAADAHDYIPNREELEELQRSLQATHRITQGSEAEAPDLLGFSRATLTSAEEKRQPFRQNPTGSSTSYDVFGPCAGSSLVMPKTPHNSVRVPSGQVLSAATGGAPASGSGGAVDLLGSGDADLLGVVGSGTFMGEVGMLGVGSNTATGIGDGKGASVGKVEDDLLDVMGDLSVTSPQLGHPVAPVGAYDPFAPVNGSTSKSTEARSAAMAEHAMGASSECAVMGSVSAKALSAFDDLIPNTEAVKKYGAERSAEAAMDRLLSVAASATKPSEAEILVAMPSGPPPEPPEEAPPAPPSGLPPMPPPSVPPPMPPSDLPTEAPLMPPPDSPSMPPAELPPNLPSSHLPTGVPPPVGSQAPLGNLDASSLDVLQDFDESNLMGGVAPPPFAPPPPPPAPDAMPALPPMGAPNVMPSKATQLSGRTDPPRIDSVSGEEPENIHRTGSAAPISGTVGPMGGMAGSVTGGMVGGSVMGGVPTSMHTDPKAMQSMMASMTPEQQTQMMQEMMAMNQQLMMMMGTMGGGSLGGSGSRG